MLHFYPTDLAVHELLAERGAEREEVQAREGRELHRHELLDLSWHYVYVVLQVGTSTSFIKCIVVITYKKFDLLVHVRNARCAN